MSAASALLILLAFAMVIPIGVGTGWVLSIRRRRRTPFGVTVVAQESVIFGVAIAAVAIVVQLLAGSPIAISLSTLVLGPFCTLAGVSTYWRKRWKPEDRMTGERGVAHRERWTIRQAAAVRRRGGGTGPWGLIGPLNPWRGVEALWAEIDGALSTQFADARAHTARVGVRLARPYVDELTPDTPWPERPVLGKSGNPVMVTIPVGKPGDGRMGAAVGGTGGGKTTTVTRIILAMAELHRALLPSVVIIDPKGDPALERTARQVAALLGVPFRAWGPQWPESRIDPLHTSSGHNARDTNARIVSRMLASFDWTESFYESRSRVEWTRAIGYAERAGAPITFENVARLMTRPGLASLAKAVRDTDPKLAKEIAERIEATSNSAWKDLTDLASRLEGFAVGGYAQLFGAHEDGVPAVSDLLDGPGVTYLRLDVSEYPNDGPGLVELLLTGLTQDSPLLAGRPGVLFLDELSAAPAERVVPLLDRGRSAGWNIILGTQTLSGLDSESMELRAAILGDCHWISVHGSTGQDDRGTDDPERIAKVIGTRPVITRTHQTQGALGLASGMGSAGASEEYIVNPSVMRGLGRGQAVMVQPRQPTTSPERAQLTAIVAPQINATFDAIADDEILGFAADLAETPAALDDDVDQADELPEGDPLEDVDLGDVFGPPDLDETDEPDASYDEPAEPEGGVADDEPTEDADHAEDSNASEPTADVDEAPAEAAPVRRTSSWFTETDDES